MVKPLNKQLHRLPLVSLIFFGLTSLASADEMQNQEPTQRIEIIKASPNAKSFKAQVKELTAESFQKQNRSKPDIVPYILKMGNGDPAKMAELLTQGSREPASYMNSTADFKAKLPDLTQKARPLPEQRRP
jgi:hypothetical protein